MKSHTLARFVPPPPPPPKPVCLACKSYAPEVTVPIGEGAIDLCWLCAHHHIDHGVPLSECATSERCEHAPHEIYPWRQPDPLEVDAPGAPVLVPTWRARGGRAAGMPGASYPRPRKS